MKKFITTRIETTIAVYTLAIYADTPEQANARASGGSIGEVLEKEGVELLDKNFKENCEGHQKSGIN